MSESEFPSPLPRLEHQEVILLARSRARNALPALNNPLRPAELVTRVVREVAEIMQEPGQRPRRYRKWMRETIVAVARREAQQLVDPELARREQQPEG